VELAPASDAVSALVNLGYRRVEAFGAVASATRRSAVGAGTDALIRAGLQELALGAQQSAAQAAPPAISPGASR